MNEEPEEPNPNWAPF